MSAIYKIVMPNISIGCAGWDYKDWIGPFYPKNLQKSDKLTYYSKFFQLVEINSTFYNLPSEKTVIRWGSCVGEKFRFSVKVWKKITHDLSNPEIDASITTFFYRLAPLENKITTFLLQFPPWFKFSAKNFKYLRYLLNSIPEEHRYVIELRNSSWFKPDILSKISDGNRIVLGTTYIPDVSPHYAKNQDWYYIRMIGDRELTIFNRIQRKQEVATKDLKEKVDTLKNSSNIHEIFIIVNNHFTGFAPEMVNNVNKLLKLPYRKFNKQKSLIDFT